MHVLRCLLAMGGGLVLSAIGLWVGLEAADAVHMSGSREYFGAAAGVSDDKIFDATAGAVLGFIVYFASAALAFWGTGKEQVRTRRAELRLCLVLGALPGAGLGFLVFAIGALFSKGVA